MITTGAEPLAKSLSGLIETGVTISGPAPKPRLSGRNQPVHFLRRAFLARKFSN